MSQKLGIKRNPTQQDVSWFLDLYKWEQIDLDPPYQRLSIWNKKDKQFFLDTVFHNYPCPAIYIQKETVDGKSTYNVVDGKQRLKTVFDFFENKIAIPSNFGDSRLNDKKWREISGDPELANFFYNYTFTVEILSGLQPNQWSDVFDRLNRNAHTLKEQELRHARYNGWLITTVEEEADEEEKDDKFWKNIGISTPGRNKRMKDIEFISILMLVVLEKQFVGFPQSTIDELYSKYDEVIAEDDEPAYQDFSFLQADADAAKNRFTKIKSFIQKIQEETQLLTAKFFRKKTTTYLYSLWAYFAINEIADMDARLPNVLKGFFEKLETLAGKDSTEYAALIAGDSSYEEVKKFHENSTGAATEVALRKARHDALTNYIASVMQ